MKKYQDKLAKMKKLEFWIEWERVMNSINKERKIALQNDENKLRRCIKSICGNSGELFAILKNECKSKQQENDCLKKIYDDLLQNKDYGECKNLEDILYL